MTTPQDILNILQCFALFNVKPYQLSLVDIPGFGHVALNLFVRQSDTGYISNSAPKSNNDGIQAVNASNIITPGR